MRPSSTVPASFLLPTWLRSPALSIGAAKEFREILPYWVVAMVVSLMGLAGWPGSEGGSGMSFTLYLAGEVAVVAMGAASFGHEFTHRTLVLALSQPRSRQEVWWGKLRVLGLAMVCVVMVRLVGPVLRGNGQAIFEFAGLMSLSAPACGLLVAPLFTLWSRSTLAGTVFAVALPLVTFQTAALADHVQAYLRFGAASEQHVMGPEAGLRLFVVLTIAQWVVAPILGYDAFRRLQASDGGGRMIRLPGWLGRCSAVAAGTRRRGAWWAGLARKELRLLGPVYVVVGLYLLTVLVDLAQRRVAAAELGAAVNRSGLMEAATLMYAVLVSLLTGALACAEDRHAGTLPWQLVQPIAVWRQWLTKAGVALGVALVLAIGLPLLVLNAEQARALAGKFAPQPALAYGLAAAQVLALCTLALYISTLTASAMRAVLWAMPLGLALETIGWGLLDSPRLRSALWNWWVPFETDGRSLVSPAGGVWVLFWGVWVAGAFLVPLACACRNFRRLDLNAARVAGHVGFVAGYTLLAAAAGLTFKRVMNAVGATLPMRPETAAERQAAACWANVSEIANAVSQWALARGHRVPGSLAELTNELASPRVLVCPADEQRQPATNWAGWNTSHVTYSYAPQPAEGAWAWTAELRCPVHGTKSVVGTVLRRYRSGAGATNAGGTDGAATRRSESDLSPELRMMRRYGILPQETPREGTKAVPRAP